MRRLAQRLSSHGRELGRLGPMALVSTVLPIVGSTVLLSFAYPLGYWLRENWETGVFAYAGAVLFFCGLALLPTNVIGLLGGWAFSFELGLLTLMAGIVGASYISFRVNSRYAGERLPHVAGKHPKADAIYNALVREGFWRTTLIVVLLRMSVIMPFALTNFLLASARVPARSFVLGTAVGMLPRSSAMVFVGAGLSELTFEGADVTWAIFFGIAASIVAVVVVALFSKRALDRILDNPRATA